MGQRWIEAGDALERGARGEAFLRFNTVEAGEPRHREVGRVAFSELEQAQRRTEINPSHPERGNRSQIVTLDARHIGQHLREIAAEQLEFASRLPPGPIALRAQSLRE